MPATITTRRLDTNHDPVYGTGGLNLLTDIEAVAQIIQTRLLLFQGEWWENTQEGIPLWQSILGVGGAGRNLPAINLIIQRRILGSPYVTGIQNLQSSYNPRTRSISYYVEVKTQFGPVVVTNIPTPPDQSLEV